MKRKVLGGMTLLLVVALLISCGGGVPHEDNDTAVAEAETAELQPRGNGTVELVTEPVYHGTYSAKLVIPEHYSWGDAARIAVPLDSVTLNDITSLSCWYYVDPATPANPDGTYPVPYITFEVDTDSKPGCDTWVIGGGGVVLQSSGVWLKNTMESDWLFHVASTFADYKSPFPLSSMGSLAQIKAAMGPDGTTPLGNCIVSKVRIAIGNWGEGGPRGPVIHYVDHLMCNGKLLF